MSDVYRTFLEEFGRFTQIQEAAIPIIESGTNCIITAPPGSGKTEAAILPVLKKISQKEQRSGVSALYVTPLRALNRDLFKRLKLLGDKLGIRIDVRHGDTPQSQRLKQSKNPPDILITTPETVQSLLMTKKLYSALSSLEFVIVDELHELYYNKRGAQLCVALERLVEISREFQRIGISATIGDIGAAAFFLCAARPCEVVEIKKSKEFSIEIEMPRNPKDEHSAFVEKFNLDRLSLARIEYIANCVQKSKATIIFANTRQIVESLGNKLLYFNNSVHFGGIGVHHSSLDKQDRIDTENAFKEGKVRSIIATSSLELGIDIGSVDLVIQFGSPRQATRLVQRMGRSGHSESRISFGKIVVASTIEALESAAVLELARQGKLEKKSIQENPQDVLLNQIVALTNERKEVSAEFCYGVIRRSSCYSKFERGHFENLLHFANKQHLLKYENGKISAGSRSKRYLIEKISVIPDATKFVVKNISTSKIISYLDENFVYGNVDEGATFVTKGLVWKVLSIDENTIFVEPSTQIEAAIPDWDGEDIPVSYQVASLAFGYFDRANNSKIKQLLSSSAYGFVVDTISTQDNYFRINENVLYIEELEGRAIIYSVLGKLGNELLAKILLGLASNQIGKKISARATPYAVVIDYEGYNSPDFKKLFDALKEYALINLVTSPDFALGFESFRHKFVQVAKLFGIIDKKATITRGVAAKLMSFYRDSPVFEEAMRDLTQNNFDIEAVMNLQSRLIAKQTKLAIIKSSGSALAGEILRSAYSYRELLNPLIPSSMELEQFAQGLLTKNAELICTFCNFKFKRKISEFEEHHKIGCPSCKSPMVAVYETDYEKAIEKRISGGRLTKNERELLASALASASLVEAYGVRALLALATYGVGIMTAGRILRMLRKDLRLFLVDLINAQKTFVKNKKYWAGK